MPGRKRRNRGRIGQLRGSNGDDRIDGFRLSFGGIPILALGLTLVSRLQPIASCHEVMATHEFDLSPRHAAGHVLGHESSRFGAAAVAWLAIRAAARAAHGSSMSGLASIAFTATTTGAAVAGFAIGANAAAAARPSVAGLTEIADAKAASGTAAACHTVVADAGTAAGPAIGRAASAAYARFARRVERGRAVRAERQRQREDSSGPHRIHEVSPLLVVCMGGLYGWSGR